MWLDIIGEEIEELFAAYSPNLFASLAERLERIRKEKCARGPDSRTFVSIKCGWCGQKLKARTNQKHCNERCAGNARYWARALEINAKRRAKYDPAAYRAKYVSKANTTGTCLCGCGRTFVGRKNRRFFESRCRKAYARSRGP